MIAAFVRALALALGLFPSLAAAQSPIKAFPPGAFQSRPPYVGGGGGSPPSYALIGTFSTSGSGASFSQSINIGTAATGRIIVGATIYQTATTLSSVTLNSIACTIDVNNAGSGNFSCPWTNAYGSGAQTLVVTWSAGSFDARGFTVWEASNCVSSTVVQTASGTTSPATLSVTAGDLMFGATRGSSATAATWSSSTQAPSNTQLIVSGQGASADWLISATNASFSVTPQTVTGLTNYSIATYH